MRQWRSDRVNAALGARTGLAVAVENRRVGNGATALRVVGVKVSLFGLLALTSAAVASCSSTQPASSHREATSAVVDEPLSLTSITESGDELRTGWYANQPKLSPGVVGASTFGQLFSTAVAGQVYAQPLYSQGTLFVATESNDIYGLDAGTGAELWHRNLGTPFDATVLNCQDLVPSIGITGTPVIDSATNTAYFFAKVGLGAQSAYYAHAVDVATGVEKPNFPVKITGTAQNVPSLAFDAYHHLQRPALLLLNGVVYAGFGSHCDAGPWQGWIVGVTTSGVVKTLWTPNSGATGAGIWMSGSGLVSDGAGRLFFATGNGGGLQGPIAGNSASTQLTLGEAVVRVDVQGDGSLKANDFFSPYDAQALDGWDADFASGGPVGLPDSFGTATFPHLLVAVGKQGYVYELNRDDLGGIGNGPGQGDAYVSRTPGAGGVWSKPAAWSGDGGFVYLPTASSGGAAGATSGFLYAYKPGVDVTGKPTLDLAGKTNEAFGFSSSRPVITSDGTTGGSGIVWIIRAADRTGVGAQLRAYRAVPNATQDFDLLFSAPIGQSTKYNPPGIGNGHVYVGTRDGHVLGFGSPSNPVLAVNSADFGSVIVGNAPQQTVVITANQALTINAVTLSSTEFSVGTPDKTTLAAGETAVVKVTFKPLTSGLKAATLVVDTDQGSASASTVGRALAKTAELQVDPKAVSFGGTTINGTLDANLVISNTGATALVLQGFVVPASPFSAVQLPTAGTTIAPDKSLSLALKFSPLAKAMYTDSITLKTSAGNLAVPLSGICADPGNLVISPQKLAFGRVALGATRRAVFNLENTGGVGLGITKSKPPALGLFSAVTSLAEGSSLAAEESIPEWVSFSPTAVSNASDVWTINATDANGVRQVEFTGSGVNGVDSFQNAGWQLNGVAHLNAGSLVLTQAEMGGQVGSAFWKTAMPVATLDASFDITLGDGEGADGMTFTLLDAGVASPFALGGGGGGLGFSGVTGVAIAFDTYKNGTDPSNNFVGITTGPGATGPDNLVWQATSTTIAALRGVPAVTHPVRVHVDTDAAQKTTLVVEIDGLVALTLPITLPPQVFAGFTGATGGATDLHEVSNISLVTDLAPPDGTGGSGGTGGTGGTGGSGGAGGDANNGGNAGSGGASSGGGNANAGDSSGGASGNAGSGAVANGGSAGSAGTGENGGSVSGGAAGQGAAAGTDGTPDGGGAANGGDAGGSVAGATAVAGSGPITAGGSGCGCHLESQRTPKPWLPSLSLALGLLAISRRRTQRNRTHSAVRG